MNLRFILYFVGFAVLFWAYPQSACAFVPHWDPKEGFFVRQFSYLFFLVAMLFFFYELKQEKLQEFRGFRFLTWASVFFALWNLDCFVGQLIALELEARISLRPTESLLQRLPMTDLATWFYYFTKLDHVLLVPAFYFLYLGIKALGQELKVKQG